MKQIYQFVSPHLRRFAALCLLILTTFSVTAQGGGKSANPGAPLRDRISVNFKNASLEQVLRQLEAKSGYQISCSPQDAKGVTGINLSGNNLEIKSILTRVLDRTGLAFTIDGRTIRIAKAGAGRSAGKAEPFVVTGQVTNRATKAPVVGAAVFVPGSSVSDITDSQGRYRLAFRNKPDKITIQFLGMESETVAVNGRTTIDVALAEKTESIDDVVVTGYTNIRKEGFTGNTTRITKEELTKVSPKNVIAAIQVFDPSFRIMDNIDMGSNPNALPEFYIRGQTSVNMEFSTNTADISRQNLTNNNNLPIFILDGFEVSVEKIYDMDPTRIHSLTLLKDAAATALYGSRAANGVVVIESRAPEPGKLRISYNFTGSVEMPDLSAYNLMNAREKLQAEVDAGYYKLDPDPSGSGAVMPSYNNYIGKLNNINRGVETDWMAQAVRTTFHHKHSLYIDGGEKDVRWGVELKYDGNKGVMKGSDRKTYGAGLTLDYRIGRFQILNRLDYDIMESNELPNQSFSDYTHLQPYDVPTDPATGKYVRKLPNWEGQTSPLNPLYEAKYMNSFYETGYKNITNKLSINFFATTDLTAKVQFSLDKKYNDSEKFIDPSSSSFLNETRPAYLGSLNTATGDYFSYNLNALLLYNKSIGKNYINVTAGAELLETNQSSTTAKYTGFSSGAVNSINDAMRIDAKPVRSSNKTRLASFLMVANYSYDDIYLLDASIRLDGSSEFGKDKKTAPFWAAGAGINLHNYKFLKDNPVLSRLKLRATYGQLGKVNFPVYAAKSSYVSTSMQDWYLTGMGNMLQFLGNDDLTWEKTNTIDAGVDLGFFQDRLLLKVSYYNKKTVDMITSVTLPSSSGFTSYYDNMGEVENKGYEIDLRYNFYRTKDFDLTVFANLSHNKNRILKVSEALKAYNDLVDKQYADYDKSAVTQKDPKYSRTYTKFMEGGSTTSIFAMQSLGINPANGKELYLRPDGEVTYEWNAADQVIVGNTEPKAQGSFGLNARWRNFSLFASFLYRFGGQQYNQTLVNYVENVNLITSNADRRVGMLRWVKPGDLSPLKDISESSLVTRPTSRFVQDDNVLQFNSLSLSYDFKQGLIRKWGMGMLRLTASMEDLSYWSSIHRERGLSYPYSKIINFAVNVTF